MIDSRQVAGRRGGPIFYGWLIVAVAFVVGAFGWSTRASFAVIYVAMLDDLGWTRAQAVFGYGLSWLLLGVFAPLSGWLYDRLGPRVVVPAGGVSLALGLILTSFVQEPWQYLLSFGPLVGFGIAATLSVSNALISRWFVRRRGTALGIVTAGTSVGTLVSLPLVAQVVAATGWREALIWYGVTLLVALLPLPALLYRRSPQSVGLVPDGQIGEATASRVRITSERAWTVREAIRTQTFWGAFVMLLLGVVAYQVLTTHQVAHAADRGIDPITAAFIFGLAGVYQFGGNLLGGWLSDRIGRQAVFLGGSLLGLLAIGMLATVSGPADIWKLHVFALAVGLGFGARISLLSAIPADAFGGPSFGLILGLLQAGSGLGGFIGPILGGLVFDLTGSYAIAFVTAAAAVLLSGIAAWFARPPRQSRADAPATAPVAAPVTATEWLTARRAEEAALAQRLLDWSRQTGDANLRDALEFAASRARERAFFLRRAGARVETSDISAGEALTAWSAAGDTDQARLERLRPALIRYAGAPDASMPLPPDLLARFQTSEPEVLALLTEIVERRGAAGRVVNLQPEPRPLPAVEGVYWEVLCPGGDGRPAIARVWQAPGRRILFASTASRFSVFGLAGRGILSAGDERAAVEPGGCLTPADSGEICCTAGPDAPLRYLIIAAGLLPRIAAAGERGAALPDSTPGLS